MNKINTFFGLCIVSLVLACNTVIDLRSAKVDGEDGGSVGNGTTTTSTSSSTTSESGAGGSAGNMGCEPFISFTTHTPDVTTASPGDLDAPFLLVDISVSDCQDVEIRSFGFQLSTPDAASDETWPFCAGACESPTAWNFRNIKFKDIVSGQTFMGPMELGQATVNQPAAVFMKDAFLVKAGETRTLAFTMDIADPLMTDIIGMRYQAFTLGVDVNVWPATFEWDNSDSTSYITVL